MTKKLTYTLLIRHSPNEVLPLLTALQFCEALIKQGHTIQCVFFQNDAAYLGLNSVIALEGIKSIHSQWQNFINITQLPAFICSNSALRRGVVDAYFGKENSMKSNLAPMFQLATLGTLFGAIESSDRFMQL